MIVQWLANGCHHALSPPFSALSMNAIRFLLRRGRDFAWNEWNGREWGTRLPAFLMKFLGQIKAIT